MDRSFVERARHGDHDAFSVVVLATGDRLFRVARLILRDRERAEDAVQDAFERVWRDLPRLHDASRFEAWATRVLVNVCRDEARRARRRVDVRLVPDIQAPDSSTEVITRERLDRGFERLPLEQRAVLVLHHYAGLSLDEIAAATGRPVGTVKSRLHYATQSMRGALEADDRATDAAQAATGSRPRRSA